MKRIAIRRGYWANVGQIVFAVGGGSAADLKRVAFYLIQSFILNDEAAFAMANAFGVQDEFD